MTPGLPRGYKNSAGWGVGMGLTGSTSYYVPQSWRLFRDLILLPSETGSVAIQRKSDPILGHPGQGFLHLLPSTHPERESVLEKRTDQESSCINKVLFIPEFKHGSPGCVALFSEKKALS